MARIDRTKDAFKLTLDQAELTLLNNALNQALELPASEFRTLMGSPKKAAMELLQTISTALGQKGTP